MFDRTGTGVATVTLKKYDLILKVRLKVTILFFYNDNKGDSD